MFYNISILTIAATLRFCGALNLRTAGSLDDYVVWGQWECPRLLADGAWMWSLSRRRRCGVFIDLKCSNDSLSDVSLRETHCFRFDVFRLMSFDDDSSSFYRRLNIHIVRSSKEWGGFVVSVLLKDTSSGAPEVSEYVCFCIALLFLISLWF